MNLVLRQDKAFTLVEVLISVVIIAMVSITSFMGFYVVTRANESAHNRLNAVTLGQAALEEVRGVAKSSFDSLETIAFADIDQARFPGFHRTVTITAPNTQVKKADVTITWQERGESKQLNFSAIISLPQEPLPANIHGKITNYSGGASISNASIHLEYVGNSSLTVNTTSNSSGDFTFVDSNGNFALKPGSWNLTVKCSGFIDSAVIEVANLLAGEDRLVNVTLKAAGPGHIKGRIIQSDTLTALPVYAYLYEDGTQITRLNNGTGNGFDFSVQFTSEGKRCFTVNTYAAYQKLYAGNFCDHNGWGKNYNYQGVSTSILREDNSAICSNPWDGSSAADRVCLSLGETVNLGDIAVYPMPTATLSGTVKDGSGNLVPGATVTITLHDYSYQMKVTTDANGHYTAQIPAEQEIFPDTNTYYVRAYAAKKMDMIDCCNVARQTNITSIWNIFGPTYAGGSYTSNFVLPTNTNCGNVHGTIRDQLSGAALPEVAINISGRADSNVTTDSSGNYQYACPDLGYCLPATYLTIIMQKPYYYTFDNSTTNIYYVRQLLLVKLNQDITYSIKMLQMRFGVIRGKVVITGTQNPISGATVTVDNSTGTNTSSTQTDADGNFVFPSVLESWPPPEIAGNAYYKHTVMNHTITVSRANYTTKVITDVALNAGEDKDMGSIGLSSGGGM